jgi:hypothetical protein
MSTKHFNTVEEAMAASAAHVRDRLVDKATDLGGDGQFARIAMAMMPAFQTAFVREFEMIMASASPDPDRLGSLLDAVLNITANMVVQAAYTVQQRPDNLLLAACCKDLPVKIAQVASATGDPGFFRAVVRQGGRA